MNRKGTVGDLKRALAAIPDGTYVIIPQDTLDGERSCWAYWNGDPFFYYRTRVVNNVAAFGFMDVETLHRNWDTVVYLTEGDDFTPPPGIGNPTYFLYIGVPCKSGLDGSPTLYWSCIGGRYNETAAIILFERTVAEEPYPQRPIRLGYRPGRVRDEVIIRRNDEQDL